MVRVITLWFRNEVDENSCTSWTFELNGLVGLTGLQKQLRAQFPGLIEQKGYTKDQKGFTLYWDYNQAKLAKYSEYSMDKTEKIQEALNSSGTPMRLITDILECLASFDYKVVASTGGVTGEAKVIRELIWTFNYDEVRV